MNIIPRCVVARQENGRSTIIQDRLCQNLSEHIPGLIISRKC